MDEIVEPMPEGESKAITVPMDMMPGCKPGDTYTVKSVDDGNVVLDYAPAAGGDDSEEWGKGLTAAMAGAEGGM